MVEKNALCVTWEAELVKLAEDAEQATMRTTELTQALLLLPTYIHPQQCMLAGLRPVKCQSSKHAIKMACNECSSDHPGLEVAFPDS